ncbi:alkaline phosphatase [Echinicola strongylocentroti]|uniref:Alkaline phosphatase n=1 Tax=Echinicola strongylocentroti TaxID=1795355 RepID=A0A2Z4IMV7_9BACT|nr:alkaline phosphatase [Echinicola strongylocentroti]AWW32235.1 alkaline phosphatase [Echinicola strongylocentroti]
MKNVTKKTKFILLLLLFPLLVFGQHPSKPALKHVILIGCDGLGAYAMPNAEMPYLKKMMEKGSWTLEARSVLPSSSAVNWASMIMGAGPTAHGYTEWGSKTPEIPSGTIDNYGLFPSIFGQLRQQQPSATSAAIYSWGGIGPLLEKDAIDWVIDGEGKDDWCAQKAASLIKEEQPNLLFVHFDQPDGVGHNIGHDTPEYYDELKNVDKRIETIYKAVQEAGIADQTVIIVSSDHGGIDKGHGGKSTEEVYIPWVIQGPGIQSNHEITDLVMTYDTAATIARLLGVTPHTSWRGRPVTDSFIIP